MPIENAYKIIIEEYMNAFKERQSTSVERRWIITEYPHLVRENILSVLYDMNVHSYNAPFHTGICLPVALFVKSYMKDVHDVDVEMIGLWEASTFCHCVIKYNEKYYDTFCPEGINDLSKMIFADQCTYGSVDHIIELYRNHEHSSYLKHNLFDAAKSRLYSKDDTDKNYILNLSKST